MKRLLVLHPVLLLALLAAAGCRAPDYTRSLGPGVAALVRVDLDGLDLPLEKEWYSRESILPALENSLYWTRREHAEKFFPMAGIHHDRALASLERMHELILESASGEEFARRFESEFDAYVSAGWNGRGGGVLFTGYCTPLLSGNLERTARYRYPLYAKPEDLEKDAQGKTLGWRSAGGLVPFPVRGTIEAGFLEGRELELVWLEDPIDAYIAHVNGSAFVELPTGETLRFGYSAKNGRPYSSLGKALIASGRVRPEEMSLAAIRKWAESTPGAELQELLNANESYVFFQPIEGTPHGSLDVEVTAERSLATDKTLFPRGALVFVDAELPTSWGEAAPFRKFMFDQDTGGAIRTAGRADIYLGVGHEAEKRAGRVKAEGQLYYFFLKLSALP